MTQPNPPAEQVERLARRYRKVPERSLYAAFCGSVESTLHNHGLSDAERLTEISNALTALDMVRAEVRAVFAVPAAVPPPIEDERCETCGESLREIALGTLGHIPGESCAPVDETPAAPVSGAAEPIVHYRYADHPTACGLTADEMDPALEATALVGFTCQDCRDALNAAR